MSGRLSKIQDWEQLAREAGFEPAKMAAHCFVSQRQMQRHFAQSFQTTPRKWLRELQFRLARELIDKGYLNKTIASELGFADESHFCHEFKKVFKTSPQRLGAGGMSS